MSTDRVSKEAKDRVLRAWGMRQMEPVGPASARNERRLAAKAAKKKARAARREV